MNLKHIEKEMSQLGTLSDLARVFSELSSIRMKATRGSVVFTRSFVSSINEIFGAVLSSYYREVQKLQNKKGGGGVTFLAHNGKTVAVLLSSNSALFGPVMNQTFELFIQEARKEDVEVTIIGSWGVRLFTKESPGKPYTYFELPERAFTHAELSPIARHLVQYEAIHVYFPQFSTIISQKPAMSQISAQPSIDETTRKEKYLFEPDLKDILLFFETEIFTSLFDQTLKEAELARHASRIVAMDAATDAIKKKLQLVRLEKLRMMHRVHNQKQMEQMVSHKALLWARPLIT